MNVVPFEYLVAREVRSRRFEVLSYFDFVAGTRISHTMPGVVSFWILMLRAGAQEVGSRAIV